MRIEKYLVYVIIQSFNIVISLSCYVRSLHFPHHTTATTTVLSFIPLDTGYHSHFSLLYVRDSVSNENEILREIL